MAAGVVTVLALAGLVVVALLFHQEPGPGARAAALVGGALGFAAGLGAALLSEKPAADAVAIALIGAAVLPLVLLGQVRLLRALTARR